MELLFCTAAIAKLSNDQNIDKHKQLIFFNILPLH